MNNYKYDEKYLELNGQNSEIAEVFSKYSNIEAYLKIKLNKFNFNVRPFFRRRETSAKLASWCNLAVSDNIAATVVLPVR